MAGTENIPTAPANPPRATTLKAAPHAADGASGFTGILDQVEHSGGQPVPSGPTSSFTGIRDQVEQRGTAPLRAKPAP